MTLPRTLVLIALLSTCRTFAQPARAGLSTPGTNAAGVRAERSLAPLVTLDPQLARQDVITGKHLQVSGPLVRPLRARKFWDFPLRLLRLANPFAAREAAPEPEPLREESPRAWTAVVGWNPGASMFPDPLTDHPGLTLITVSHLPQP